MLTPTTIKPNPDAAGPLTNGADTTRQLGISPVPWPSDTPKALPGDDQLDDTLTEAAGMARNTDALGPYAGSF